MHLSDHTCPARDPEAEVVLEADSQRKTCGEAGKQGATLCRSASCQEEENVSDTAHGHEVRADTDSAGWAKIPQVGTMTLAAETREAS